MQENILLVTGSASEVFAGRAAQLLLWQKDFETPERAVYVRTTMCVRVSEAFPVALESGHWRGERQAGASGARSFAAGSYAAKWRRVDGTWLLEAELFSTEDCGGDFCPRVDRRRRAVGVALYHSASSLSCCARSTQQSAHSGFAQRVDRQ
jgi:hypothetical protein